MATCITIPSYIMHHVFSFYSLKTQLRTLGMVCKSWHHTALCMNCVTSSSTHEELRVWFGRYFDTEVATMLTKDYKVIMGAPYSYVVRNLVFHALRDIQEAVPHLEAEIFELHSRLESTDDRSEKLVKVYQWSALLYLLKKLESTFNIYDIFLDINTAVAAITVPVCKRDGLKLFAHLGALIKFRFDGNPAHMCDVEFHMLAAIKCFDLKLLIKNNTVWLPIYKLIEAAIGPKFLKPRSVFQNFDAKLVAICKQGFTDFNEVLSILDGNTAPTGDEEVSAFSDSPPMRASLTEFPVITNEQLYQCMQLQPNNSRDRQHLTPRSEPNSPSCNTENTCNMNNNNNSET